MEDTEYCILLMELNVLFIINNNYYHFHIYCDQVRGLRLLICGSIYSKELKEANRYQLFEDTDRMYNDTGVPYYYNIKIIIYFALTR